MKNLFYILFLALAAVACSGNIDDNAPAEYVEPYTLSVDKTVVEASGMDTVTFSLMDSYGRDILLDRVAMQNVNIVCEDGTTLKRMTNVATYSRNGQFVYSAMYKGVKSVNTVTVEAKNRAKYEVFARRVGLFKCTSVWCSACPTLATALHNLSDEAKQHSVVLSCHGNFNYNDPFSLYIDGTDLGTYLMGRIGGSGWPTLIYDLKTAVSGSKPGMDGEIAEMIIKCRAEYPATCGIKVSEVKTEMRKEDGKDVAYLVAKVSLKTSTGGKYDLAGAVLRDGLSYQAEGVYSANNDGVYDEVVLNLTNNFLRYNAQTGKDLKADEEYSQELAFSFGSSEIPSKAELAKYRVAVWAHRSTDEGSRMDNITECAYGKSVDYLLNE